MLFNPNIKKGESVDNNELCKLFGCSPQGGMRRSHSTNTLVLVSNRIKSVYEDVWDGNILYYTGMGQEGDQSLSSQNKTLFESNRTGVRVFLFEVFEEKKYFYQGEVKLAQKPYQDIQPDINNNPRKVWIFPVQSIDSSVQIIIPEEIIKQKQITRQKRVSKLTDNEVKEKAKAAHKKCCNRATLVKQYDRDDYVIEHAKRRARGHCELCKNAAPFRDQNGISYLETHHIIWLSKGGEDSIENTVALCPNCHRKMHVLDSKNDINYLLSIEK